MLIWVEVCICRVSIFFQFKFLEPVQIFEPVKFLGTSSNFLNQCKMFEPVQSTLNWYQIFNLGQFVST